jgi:adenylate cyclase
MLRRSDSLDEPAYQFGHPLIQEVAYTTQLRSRRNRLHASVAQAIERLYTDRADEFAALVAHHLEEAGERGRAVFYAARAARWIGRTSSEQAIRLWHKVRVLLSDEPRLRANDALRIEASGQIAWVGWREGLTTDEARPFIQEALSWAREIDDSIIPLLLLVDGRIAQVLVATATRSCIKSSRRLPSPNATAIWAGLRHCMPRSAMPMVGPDCCGRRWRQAMPRSPVLPR